MALKRKKKTKETPSKSKSAAGENFVTISTAQKKKIFGIFLLLFSVLILLSILSYSPFDKAVIQSDNLDLMQKAESTRNWLGILGAYTSDFFINGTLGIFSAVFPIMFFIWGYSFFQKISFRFIIHTSNFLPG